MKNIFSIIIIVVSLATFGLVVKPQYSQIKEMQTTDNELESVLDNARTLQSLRDSLLEKRKSLANADISRLEKLIPESADNVKLILEFEQIAAQNNLEIQTASATKDEYDESGTTQGFDVESKDYGIITLDFTLSGGYTEFIAFLSGLEKNIRITDLQTLSISPPSQGGSIGGQYQYNMSIDTYWLKDNI